MVLEDLPTFTLKITQSFCGEKKKQHHGAHGIDPVDGKVFSRLLGSPFPTEIFEEFRCPSPPRAPPNNRIAHDPYKRNPCSCGINNILMEFNQSIIIP